MELNLTNIELNYLREILDKELLLLEKEIHRTDALVYKHELEEKERQLKELKNKLHSN